MKYPIGEYIDFKRKNYLKKLVLNARALIVEQIDMPTGIHRVFKNINQINQIKIIEINYNVFQNYIKEVKKFQLGTKYIDTTKTLTLLQQKELNIINKNYHYKILKKCHEIIEKYDC
jgi:fibrillarin-like rRNA methylase